MAIQSSGTISLLDVQNEFGGGNPININEYYRGGAYVRNSLFTSGIPASGQIALSNFYGSYNYTSPSVDTSYIVLPRANGWASYRIDDGVNSVVAQNTRTGTPPPFNFTTAPGRQMVVTIHIRDDDNSGGTDYVEFQTPDAAAGLVIDQVRALGTGLSNSWRGITSINTTSRVRLWNVGGNPDRGDRGQYSIRFTVTNALINRRIIFEYIDDPRDDDQEIGVEFYCRT